MGAGIFLDFDFEHPQHSLYGIAGNHACENHDPAGEWYYGTDISVHPDYRRRGIGKRLYELRKDLVRRYNKRGIVAGGALPGFGDHKANMTALEYVTEVAAGELYDPTLTFQIQNGFEVFGVISDYFSDARSDNWASLIVWENSDYRTQAAGNQRQTKSNTFQIRQ
jgi:ribosomal protein S18 acetylase RimI-like enzyme